MKFCLFFITTLLICQHFISRSATDARSILDNELAWTSSDHADDTAATDIGRFVKRKGLGWGKRNKLMLDDPPHSSVYENLGHDWFDDK